MSQQPKPKMTIIYSCRSNQTWGNQRFIIGDKISSKDYEELPDEKKENFRRVEMDVRGFVEDLLNRVDELESKVSALEKFVSKATPTSK